VDEFQGPDEAVEAIKRSIELYKVTFGSGIKAKL